MQDGTRDVARKVQFLSGSIALVMGDVVSYVDLRTYCGLQKSECGIEERFNKGGRSALMKLMTEDIGQGSTFEVQRSRFEVRGPFKFGMRNEPVKRET